MSKLNPRQTRFVAEFFTNGMNATQAAISAGYSAKSANTYGTHLLKRRKVAALVEKKMEPIIRKLDISKERTLNELGRLAFFDAAKLFAPDGSLKRIEDIDEDTRSVIAGIEVSDIWDSGDGEQRSIVGTLKKVKLTDRLSALDKLMRYHSLYLDTVEHTHKVTLEELIMKADAAE